MGNFYNFAPLGALVRLFGQSGWSARTLMARWISFVLVMMILMPWGAAAAHCHAVGRLVKTNGSVDIQRAGDVRRFSPQQTSSVLCRGDAVITFASGHAYLTLIDHSEVVLGPDSTLTLEDREKLSMKGGDILFSIRKRPPLHGLTIRTRLSVIGVKGTRFLVTDTGKAETVILQKGHLEIAARRKPFAFYRKRSLSSFNAYRRETEQEFKAYRSRKAREFIGYVRSVSLAAGNMLVLTGNEAVEARASREKLKAIEPMMQYAHQQ